MQNRKSGGITSNMAVYAKDYQESRNLETICEELKPTVAIGASTAAGSFTEKFLQTMAKNTPKPIIFALSNPTDKAECTAEQAYKFTKVCMRVQSLIHRGLLVIHENLIAISTSTRCVGKPEGDARGSAIYFWLILTIFRWSIQTWEIERHQRGVEPPTPQQIEHWFPLPSFSQLVTCQCTTSLSTATVCQHFILFILFYFFVKSTKIDMHYIQQLD